MDVVIGEDSGCDDCCVVMFDSGGDGEGGYDDCDDDDDDDVDGENDVDVDDDDLMYYCLHYILHR